MSSNQERSENSSLSLLVDLVDQNFLDKLDDKREENDFRRIGDVERQDLFWIIEEYFRSIARPVQEIGNFKYRRNL